MSAAVEWSNGLRCQVNSIDAGVTFEGRRGDLGQANKLSRTWATLLEVLHRHRGEGHQKVTAEHVHVHAGGSRWMKSSQI